MFDNNGNLDIRIKISLYLTGGYITYQVYKNLKLEDDLVEWKTEQLKFIRNNIKKLKIMDNPIKKDDGDNKSRNIIDFFSL